MTAPRYVFLGNNQLALDVLSWLVSEGQPPAGMIVHDAARGRLREEIVARSGVDPGRVIEGPALRTDAGREFLRDLAPDYLVSVAFGYILRPDVLAIARAGAINLHTGFLPYNRGAHPNVWSIVEGTPAGATLHWVDAGVDT